MNKKILIMIISNFMIDVSSAQVDLEQLLLPRVLNEQPTIVDITDVKAESITAGTTDYNYLIYGWVLDPTKYINAPFTCGNGTDPNHSCCDNYEFCNQSIKIRMCIDGNYIATNQPNKTTLLNNDLCPTCKNGFEFIVNSSQITGGAGNFDVSLYWKKPGGPTDDDICSAANINNKIYEGEHAFVADVQDLTDPDSNRTIIGSNSSECSTNDDPIYSCNGTILITDNGDDQLFGLSGDDRPIKAKAGNDVIYGNKGKDLLNAGAGDDQAFGGLDEDEIKGGPGVDWLYGSYEGDKYIIKPSYDINHIVDPISGVNENSVDCQNAIENSGVCYFSHTRNNTYVVFPDNGALIFYDNLLTEVIIEGQPAVAGLTNIDDCLAINVCDSHEAPVNVNYETLITAGSCPNSPSCSLPSVPGVNPDPLNICSLENIQLGFSHDLIQLDSSGHYVDAASGDDQICSGNGDDVLIGGSGSDHLVGQAGNDKLIGGIGDDTLEGGIGDDIYVYEVFDGDDIIIDNSGSNKIFCLGAYGTFSIVNGDGVLDFTNQAVDPHYAGKITIDNYSSSNFTFYGCEKE